MLTFSIRRLFGTHNLEIDLSKRCAILIGENGVGKTTALKMLRCLATGDYVQLTRYPFESVIINNDNDFVKIDYEELFPDCDMLRNLVNKDMEMSLTRFLSLSLSNVTRQETGFRWDSAINLLNSIEDDKEEKQEYLRILAASYWDFEINTWFDLNEKAKAQIKDLLTEIKHENCFLLSPISMNSEYKYRTNKIRNLLELKSDEYFG